MPKTNNKCKNCKHNCCSKSFKGMAQCFNGKNYKTFSQILLSEQESKNIKEYCALHNLYGGDENKLIVCKDNLYYVKLNDNNSCPAYCNGVCTIYDVRPDVCRLYPYYFDPFCGICIDKNCPCINKIDDINEIYDILKRRITLFEKIEKEHK